MTTRPHSPHVMRFRILSMLLLAVATTCAVFVFLFITGYLHLEIVDTTRSLLKTGSKEVNQEIGRVQSADLAVDKPSAIAHPPGHVIAFEYDDDGEVRGR